jgi:hypothetical protein
MVRRRTLLGVGAAALSLGTAGCAESPGDNDVSGGGGGGATGTPNVIRVEAVTPVVEDREFATELRVEWTYRGADFLNPDDTNWRFPEGDEQHLVCQFRATNVGPAATPVGPEMFQVAAPSTENVFPSLSVDDDDQFPSRRLDADGVAEGWVVFEVPNLQDTLLLALDQDFFSAPVDAAFERADLAFDVSEDDPGTATPDETTTAEGGA